jgi:hypothetical protein
MYVLSVLRGRDPSAVAVLMEDSAAVGGVFIAASALGLVHMTGNAIYDAIGSISIGGTYMYLYLYCSTHVTCHLTGEVTVGSICILYQYW